MKIPSAQGRPDDFMTPKSAINPLLPYLPKDWAIWECAMGSGNLVKAFEEKGYYVFGSDILSGHDYLKFQAPQWDCCVTNPPYSIKQKFLERAYSLGKPFAFLLPLTTFESEKRQALFKKYGLEVIFFNKRINFETPSGNGGGSWFATAWFTWGLNIGKELNFVKLEEE